MDPFFLYNFNAADFVMDGDPIVIPVPGGAVAPVGVAVQRPRPPPLPAVRRAPLPDPPIDDLSASEPEDDADNSMPFRKCDVCLKKYNIRSRAPKVAACGHTTCHRCVRKMVIVNRGLRANFETRHTELQCPVCRAVWCHEVRRRPESMPMNFSVIEAMNNLGQVNTTQVIQDLREQLDKAKEDAQREKIALEEQHQDQLDTLTAELHGSKDIIEDLRKKVGLLEKREAGNLKLLNTKMRTVTEQNGMIARLESDLEAANTTIAEWQKLPHLFNYAHVVSTNELTQFLDDLALRMPISKNRPKLAPMKENPTPDDVVAFGVRAGLFDDVTFGTNHKLPRKCAMLGGGEIKKKWEELKRIGPIRCTCEYDGDATSIAMAKITCEHCKPEDNGPSSSASL